MIMLTVFVILCSEIYNYRLVFLFQLPERQKVQESQFLVVAQNP